MLNAAQCEHKLIKAIWGSNLAISSKLKRFIPLGL